MRVIKWVAPIMLGVVVLAGCSKSNTDSSTSTTAASTASTAPPTTFAGTGSAAVADVWPTCCTDTFTTYANDIEAVGTDMQNASSNSDAATIVTALKTAQSDGIRALSDVQTGGQSLSANDPGVGAMNKLYADVSTLQGAIGSTITSCNSLSDSCASAATTMSNDLTAVTNDEDTLNTLAGNVPPGSSTTAAGSSTTAAGQ